ncbi:MAG TPA: hypothetical protein VIX73_31450 [Kofleriaceae bacterium]
MIGPLGRWWFAPAPAERLAALRIAVGAFATLWLIGRLTELAAVASGPESQFAPVGAIGVLKAPLPPGVAIAIAVATIALLAAFTAGVGYRVVAPLAAAGALWTLSYRSSWGMVFHTDNLVVLHLIALACAPAADAWALGGRGPAPPREAGHGWAIKLLAALTCATYVVAGIAKLRLAGLDWLDGDQLRNQIAIDHVRKALLGGATAPLAAAGALWTLSYRSSWGMVFHTDNLVVLHLIALACAPAADVWALGGRSPAAGDAGYGWAIKLLAALTCATYLVAGIAKLRLAGLDWLDGDQLRNQIAIDNLRKLLLGGATAPLAAPLVGHRGALAVLSITTLAIELGAPLALLGGRVARLWALAAWLFHAGVILAMYVWFPYPLSGVAFLPLIDAERWIGWPVRRWRSRAISVA